MARKRSISPSAADSKSPSPAPPEISQIAAGKITLAGNALKTDVRQKIAFFHIAQIGGLKISGGITRLPKFLRKALWNLSGGKSNNKNGLILSLVVSV